MNELLKLFFKFIGLLFVSLFLSSCGSSGGKKTKIKLSSSNIDGRLSNCLSVKPSKQYFLFINEETFEYEIKVEIERIGNCDAILLENQQLQIDLLDKDGLPVSNFGKFRSVSKFNDEYEKLLSGDKKSMIITFAYNGVGFIDIVEGVQSFQNGQSITKNKKKFLKRLKEKIREENPQSFKISSF
jgi:hypothetical protein